MSRQITKMCAFGKNGGYAEDFFLGQITTGTTNYNNKRVYGQFSIETIHERRKRDREFSGVFFLSCLFE